MPIIQFSHANGFPAGSYRKFFAALAAGGATPRFQIRAIERIGHDPRFPVTDGWPHLVDELLAQITGLNEKVILVGHSLGGYLSFMAACKQPEKVAAVVMLDSPLTAGWKSAILFALKKTGADKHFLPANATRVRRQFWSSHDEAYQHFASKRLFHRFDPQVLRHYIEAGVQEQRGAPQDQAVRLSFDRDIEYRIYRSIPHHLYRLARRRPPFPVGFIGGTHSPELRMVGAGETRRLAGANFRMIEGGHLYPFERPEETAATVLELLKTMGLRV